MTDRTPARNSAHEDPSSPEPVRPPTNPYLLVIMAVWITAGALGLMLLAGSLSSEVTDPDVLSAVGTRLLIAAAAVALLHLAVNAVRWRAPQ
ncbi:hypothetical protein [Microbacterium sp. TNHR37B]|uniref:hypothetical protein n=1 Tax=Microbacterium sp. TNHR37B TaxID=1775956 RepID=UPI0007B1EAF9|nr:hypothetical protein [Microbacterium sp. TNHR37B]KZE91971.1 hypothetical protein AVP41_01524 [Microbacterium sp. TNHR37B]